MLEPILSGHLFNSQPPLSSHYSLTKGNHLIGVELYVQKEITHVGTKSEGTQSTFYGRHLKWSLPAITHFTVLNPFKD